MSTPRFLIAKYAPDLKRMEPRNIGLILWHKGHFGSKFLSPDQATFVNEVDVYEQWVEFWTHLMLLPEITMPGSENGQVPTTDERCLDALLATQEGNYLLVDAGFVPAKLSVRDISKAAHFLFSELVAPTDSIEYVDGESRSPTLAAQCDRVFDRSGIAKRADFRKNEPVECPVFGVRRHFHCNYYVGNGDGKPKAIFQRASLSSEQSVNSGALTIRALTEATVIPATQCRFLIKRRDVMNDAAEEGLALLSSLCGVVDVDDREAVDQIASVARNGRD